MKFLLTNKWMMNASCSKTFLALPNLLPLFLNVENDLFCFIFSTLLVGQSVSQESAAWKAVPEPREDDFYGKMANMVLFASFDFFLSF